MQFQKYRCMSFVLLCILVLCNVQFARANFVPIPRDYDIMFVNAPRDDVKVSKLPDVFHPLNLPGNSNLDKIDIAGNMSTLVHAGDKGAIFDPVMSYDGKWVYFSWCYNVEDVNTQISDLPRDGCDIWRMRIADGFQEKLTEWRKLWKPQRGIGTNWSLDPVIATPPGSVTIGYGIYAMSPVPLSTNEEKYAKFLFTCNCLNLDTIHDGATVVSFQMFIFDSRTGDIEQFWASPSAVLHPVMTSTGKILFSSLANQGTRGGRPWEMLTLEQDGSNFTPVISGFDALHSRHGHTTTRGNYAIVGSYYLRFNFLGTLLKLPLFPSPNTNFPGFGPPEAYLNVALPMGANRYWKQPFTPNGMTNFTRWTHLFDEPSPFDHATQKHVGKIGWPWAAPNNDILASYSDGPVHIKLPGKLPQLRIVIIPQGIETEKPDDLVPVTNDPTKNALFARAMVPWKRVYGGNHPIQPARIKNDGSITKHLPKGSPWGIVGSSGVWNRSTKSGNFPPNWDGQHPDYGVSDTFTNFNSQGADTRSFDNVEIAAIRILAESGVEKIVYNDPYGGFSTNTFRSGTGRERLRAIGDGQLLKFNPNGTVKIDKWGNPDSSFAFFVPCKTSFTFDLIGTKGETLSHSFTWHAVACGEVRVDCGGCHAHDKEPQNFADTIAGQPDYVPVMANLKGYSREWHTHIVPILNAKCVSCHNNVQMAGGLDFTNTTMINGLPYNAALFVANRNGEVAGPKPVMQLSTTRGSLWTMFMNASRSKLAWIIAGRRLDNIPNDRFYTELVQGDKSTLDARATYTNTDIDFTAIAEHANLNLTFQEQFSIFHWLDMGMPVDRDRIRGWLADTFAPNLTWQQTRDKVIIGSVDIGSGINIANFKVYVDGVELKKTKLKGDRWSVPKRAGLYNARVPDYAGNVQTGSYRVQVP